MVSRWFASPYVGASGENTRLAGVTEAGAEALWTQAWWR